MGVDVSTWRARVGMFTQRTSQKSPIIITAQARRQSPSNNQAPWAIPEYSIPGIQTNISGSMLERDYKPKSTHPAHLACAYVARILFTYIFHLLLLLPLLLIDSPSELRPPSSYHAGLLNPNQNETSPVQFNVQSLIILMCGDVEVNPGPLNPGSQNPGPPNPGPTNPGPTNPGPLNPGPPKPGPTNPGPLNPDPTNPGPLNPGPPNPGPPNPGLLNPGPPNPGPPNPGPPIPGPQNPGPLNPGPTNPGPLNPGPTNPGPPHKYEERAKVLTTFTVPVEDVIYTEYCCNINVDLTLKRKDRGYLEQMENIGRTVCSMLNYAGGVITLNPQTASTDKDLDEWAGKIRQQLDLVVPQEVSRCIEMNIQSGHIEMWVRKSWMFITYKSHLYTRRDAATIDGDMTMISDGTKTTFVSKVSKIQCNQLNQGDLFPLSECKNLEFKCYTSTGDATTLMDKIINDKKGGEPILIKTLLAFTNTEGGGDAVIGIREVNGAPILEGQKLSAADEGEVQRCLGELMIKGLNGQQRIWPFTPGGSEWTIKFYPLRNCRSNTRHVLIHIRVNQVAGYVLADEPEAYTMTPEGNIRHVPLNEWKICIKMKSNKSAPELLKLAPQSDEQDNDEDDIDEEQFNHLVNDLKTHRVTLSLKHIKTASWTKDSEDFQDDIVQGVNMDTCVEEVSKSDLLKPSAPSTWVPDRTILDIWITNNHSDMKDCVDAIAQSHPQDAVVIGTKYLECLFPGLSLGAPQHHAFLVLQDNAEIDLWIVFDDFTDPITCKKYANSAARILRSQLLSYIHQHTDTKAVKLAINAKIWSIADNCIKYEPTPDYTESPAELPVLQKAVAYCLLQGQSHIKNQLGEEYLTALTKDQLSGLLHCPYTDVIVFQGPPGSGKSLIAQHLCEQEVRGHKLGKDKILYICPCQPLAEFIKFQQRCDAKCTTTEDLVRTVKEALEKGILLIIIDDAHLFLCSTDEWTELLTQFKQGDKGTTERHLAVFLDPEYQNFQGDNAQNLFHAITAFNFAHPFSQVHVRTALPVVIRNSRNIFSFFKRNAEEGSSKLTCAHDFHGDGVFVNYITMDVFQRDRDNPVIMVAKETVGMYNFEENFTYKMTDITILVDVDGRGNAEQAVQELYEIFCLFYPEANTQRASQFPVQGIVIEELKSFSGLETRVCILVLACKDTSVMSNPRYKCFVASRGITKLIFLLHGDIVDSSFKQLKFSEEKQWQKLTKQLLKEIPEKGLTEKWLSANVPDTECWHKTKPLLIMRCQQQMRGGDYVALADWVDRNIPPALRRDEQFVRAVIGFVCERTITQKSPSGNEVDSVQPRAYLGALNFLNGAPESVQHKALDTVHNHVRTLQNPENVLYELLDIMWSDGYITRQVMLSWFDNIDQTCAIKFQGRQDLGEQIQERMRTRQEVRRWMRDTAQLGHHWYNSPHYQRVVLHALCQLAVTWQGEKCTVDKDLLFHYIPQLYSVGGRVYAKDWYFHPFYTSDGLQLLYAVQCVLHHLQNPPGVAVAVFQALLSITRPDTGYTGTRDKPVINTTDWEPLITSTDWDKWRNTQNPAYEEGRNIIQHQGQILDLIDLVSSEVKRTDINDWICKNIPHDEMPDAFIIAVVCLMNQEKEVALVINWISQNVPQNMQTIVHETLKTILIQIYIQNILHTMGLAVWVEGHILPARVDRHLLPAWRQDAQFVKAAITAVCEITIHSDQINSRRLRFHLGSMNCLYGAPESLQLQALESVYDYVRTLKNHEKVLQQVLNIMRSDGYINRQTILSMSGKLSKTSAIEFKEISMDNKKDLEEQIQERMRARQEVRRWMRDSTQLGDFWYDSPHYQRVTLHALCQLAVTWQGDKCTVDRDLLFHYIHQLFRYTEDGLQLLYAVQCVLHHLQNPPGLAVAVIQAVLTISRTKDKPVITNTDLDKWRNTKHPAYQEGRNITQNLGQILDLMVLVSSKVKLTEINDWICKNIPQDQMLDAFTIAAECLINQGEELTVIWDWISQDVPQSMMTAVQDTLKTLIISRCQQEIKCKGDRGVAAWMDRHILPAWRRDAQFVKAVIKAVCLRTIQLFKIDSERLRLYLGDLNCLYGAPVTLQLQVLDSVCDHVRTMLDHQDFLEILLADGYISEEAMESWSGNKDHATDMMFQRILFGNEKNLEKQIQKRMRARQEVRQWMRDTTQLGSPWYDLPHYQRVALHALCQLAVTWQGDKCTVDKDLLFHYIPQLFCNVYAKLQLLYAVQCVVYKLCNPPELYESVLEVLVSATPELTEPIITESDLKKWRETEYPAYEEGRETMMLVIKNLNVTMLALG